MKEGFLAEKMAVLLPVCPHKRLYCLVPILVDGQEVCSVLPARLLPKPQPAPETESVATAWIGTQDKGFSDQHQPSAQLGGNKEEFRDHTGSTQAP